nr:hypothetical protein HEP85_00995 [Streptomyces sp. RPA4-2]
MHSGVRLAGQGGVQVQGRRGVLALFGEGLDQQGERGEEERAAAARCSRARVASRRAPARSPSRSRDSACAVAKAACQPGASRAEISSASRPHQATARCGR